MKKVFCVLLSLVLLLSGCISPQEELGTIPDELIPLAAGPTLTVDLDPVAMGDLVQSNEQAAIDYSNYQDGYIMAAWFAGGESRIKVLIKTPTGTTYQYNLNNSGDWETFPLSDGNGKYVIGIYKNTSGTSYATILSMSLDVQLNDPFAPFLKPNQYVNFTTSSAAARLSTELCQGSENDLARVRAVYEYVVNNISYDKAKAQSVKSGYLPNVDETLATGKGICFDYAALMCAMLRSQYVPCKLIVGYTGSVYHAWINVWNDGEGWVNAAIYFDGKEWKLMDPTFASSGKQSEAIMKYIGNGTNYQAKYQY